jgi:hypothetical protein
MDPTTSPITQRSAQEAARELANHYILVHNYLEPVFFYIPGKKKRMFSRVFTRSRNAFQRVFTDRKRTKKRPVFSR